YLNAEVDEHAGSHSPSTSLAILPGPRADGGGAVAGRAVVVLRAEGGGRRTAGHGERPGADRGRPRPPRRHGAARDEPAARAGFAADPRGDQGVAGRPARAAQRAEGHAQERSREAMIRPGWQSTEFWTTLTGQLLSFLALAGIIHAADAATLQDALAKCVTAV